MKKVLVTGGSGFIGGHFVERIQGDCMVRILDIVPPKHINIGPNIEFVGCDVCDKSEVMEHVFWADRIVHLAGVLGTAELMVTPEEAVRSNVIGMLSVLEAVRVTGHHLVYITIGNNWENPYTITKDTARRFAFVYQREFGVRVAVIRGLNVYGPRQKWRPVRKFCPIFITRALRNEPLEIFGDGAQLIDIVHVADTVEVLHRASSLEVDSSDVIDAGTGSAVSVNDFAGMVIRLAGSSSEIVHVPMRPGEPLRSETLGSCDQARTLLGVVPTTDLEVGLKCTIEWYRSNCVERNLFP